MGGLIRLGNASKILYDGQDVNRIYRGTDMLWEKPIPSIYNLRKLSTTDNALMVGSSDVACLVDETWKAVGLNGYHNWFNFFRSNYTGNMPSGQVNQHGRGKRGIRASYNLGRVPLKEVVDASSSFPVDRRPLTSMANYDALMISTSDFMVGTFGRDHRFPNISDYFYFKSVGLPQNVADIDAYNWLSAELTARMRLIRRAVAAGINKIYLCSPWPRLGNFGAFDDVPHRDALDAEWRTRLTSTEDSMYFQQDRLNYQCMRENLDVHVNLIPFHRFFKYLDDYAVEADPANGILNIRELFANDNNLEDYDPTGIDRQKHTYMLNYKGGYAINSFFAMMIHGIEEPSLIRDGNNLVRDDIGNEVSVAFAETCENAGISTLNSVARAGHNRINKGYTFGEFVDGVPSEFISSDKLVLYSDQNQAQYDFGAASKVKCFHFVLEVDCEVFNALDTLLFSIDLGATKGVNVGVSTGARFNLYSEDWSMTGHIGSIPEVPDSGTVLYYVAIELPDGNIDRYGDLSSRWVQKISGPPRVHELWRDHAYSSSSEADPLDNNNFDRIIRATSDITVRDILVTNEPLSPIEEYNYFRYIQKRHQLPFFREYLEKDIDENWVDPDEGEAPIDPTPPEPDYTYGTNPDPSPTLRTPSTLSDRHVHSGHSLTDVYFPGGEWPGTMAMFAEDALGASDTISYDLNSPRNMPGSPIQLRWENDQRENLDFENFSGLVLTEMSPLWRITQRDEDFSVVAFMRYACHYAANLIERGQGDFVALWCNWPGTEITNDAGYGNYYAWPGHTFLSALDEYELIYKYVADYVTWKMKQIYPQLDPDWRVWVFPGNRYIKRVYQDANAGLVPDVDGWGDLFMDTIHPNPVFGYGVSTFMMTMLYHVDMRAVSDLRLQNGYTDMNGTWPAVTRAQADYFANISWEIANEYGPAGLGGEDGNTLLWDSSLEDDPLPEYEADIYTPPTGL